MFLFYLISPFWNRVISILEEGPIEIVTNTLVDCVATYLVWIVEGVPGAARAETAFTLFSTNSLDSFAIQTHGLPRCSSCELLAFFLHAVSADLTRYLVQSGRRDQMPVGPEYMQIAEVICMASGPTAEELLLSSIQWEGQCSTRR